MKEEIEIGEKRRIIVKLGDITEEEVEAIVNPANTKLLMGGGVAGIIKKKGGEEIEKEALRFAPIEKGGAVTTSAGRLKATYIIHAATMDLDFKTDANIIRAATYAALKEAGRKKIKSVAFPALGCGVGGFPVKDAAKIMKEEVLNYFKEYPQEECYPKEVIFCLIHEQDYRIFVEEMRSHF